MKYSHICEFCKNEFFTTKKYSKYCSTFCSAKAQGAARYQRDTQIEEWIAGNTDIVTTKTGLTKGELLPGVKKAIKEYLLGIQQHKCEICGCIDIWNNLPLVFILDHIDGDSHNNTRQNLRLICPHCDSQLSTYKSRNNGRGRSSAREFYRKAK